MGLTNEEARIRRLSIKPEYMQSSTERMSFRLKRDAHKSAVDKPRSLLVEMGEPNRSIHPGPVRNSQQQNEIDYQNTVMSSRLVHVRSPVKLALNSSSAVVFNPGRDAARLDYGKRLNMENNAFARRIVNATATTSTRSFLKEHKVHQQHLKTMSKIRVSPSNKDRVSNCDYSKLVSLAHSDDCMPTLIPFIPPSSAGSNWSDELWGTSPR